ncbi:unnamed protein product, partial [Protopolystoma xenopodis]
TSKLQPCLNTRRRYSSAPDTVYSEPFVLATETIFEFLTKVNPDDRLSLRFIQHSLPELRFSSLNSISNIGFNHDCLHRGKNQPKESHSHYYSVHLRECKLLHQRLQAQNLAYACLAEKHRRCQQDITEAHERLARFDELEEGLHSKVNRLRTELEASAKHISNITHELIRYKTKGTPSTAALPIEASSSSADFSLAIQQRADFSCDVGNFKANLSCKIEDDKETSLYQGIDLLSKPQQLLDGNVCKAYDEPAFKVSNFTHIGKLSLEDSLFEEQTSEYMYSSVLKNKTEKDPPNNLDRSTLRNDFSQQTEDEESELSCLRQDNAYTPDTFIELNEGLRPRNALTTGLQSQLDSKAIFCKIPPANESKLRSSPEQLCVDLCLAGSSRMPNCPECPLHLVAINALQGVIVESVPQLTYLADVLRAESVEWTTLLQVNGPSVSDQLECVIETETHEDKASVDLTSIRRLRKAVLDLVELCSLAGAGLSRLTRLDCLLSECQQSLCDMGVMARTTKIGLVDKAADLSLFLLDVRLNPRTFIATDTSHSLATPADPMITEAIPGESVVGAGPEIPADQPDEFSQLFDWFFITCQVSLQWNDDWTACLSLQGAGESKSEAFRKAINGLLGHLEAVGDRLAAALTENDHLRDQLDRERGLVELSRRVENWSSQSADLAHISLTLTQEENDLLEEQVDNNQNSEKTKAGMETRPEDIFVKSIQTFEASGRGDSSGNLLAEKASQFFGYPICLESMLFFHPNL